MSQILFVHQNFPGQFLHLAPALAQRGHTVTALKASTNKRGETPGVKVLNYPIRRSTTKNAHPWLIDFEAKVIRGEACLEFCKDLKKSGYSPDLIIAHPGWGESLFLKSLWPNARLAIYCEFHYSPAGSDMDFDPEFQVQDPVATGPKMAIKNLVSRMHERMIDGAISPTIWQANTYPSIIRDKIEIIHDGIQTAIAAPNSFAELSIRRGDGSLQYLRRGDPVVTFVNRNLEPYRGYHIFMRSLRSIFDRVHDAQIILIGGEGVSYGAAPDSKRFGPLSWKEIFWEEVKNSLSANERSRVHFLGHVPYQTYLSALQVSAAHVYLTYPFVLSWSLLEAMSVGCAIVGSDTAPVREVIQHEKTGLLTPFFDSDGLAEAVARLIGDRALSNRLGGDARDFVVKNYDLESVCLPRQLQWVAGLLESAH